MKAFLKRKSGMHIKKQALHYYCCSCRSKLGAGQVEHQPRPLGVDHRRQTVGHLYRTHQHPDRRGNRHSAPQAPRLACACSVQQSPPSGGPALNPHTCAGSRGSHWPATASVQEPRPAHQLSEKPEALPHTLPTEKSETEGQMWGASEDHLWLEFPVLWRETGR